MLFLILRITTDHCHASVTLHRLQVIRVRHRFVYYGTFPAIAGFTRYIHHSIAKKTKEADRAVKSLNG